MTIFPCPTWNFEELKAAIDVVLAEAETIEREDNSLRGCLMYTDIGSREDIDGVLADIILAASGDEECPMDGIAVVDSLDVLLSDPSTPIPLQSIPCNCVGEPEFLDAEPDSKVGTGDVQDGKS